MAPSRQVRLFPVLAALLLATSFQGCLSGHEAASDDATGAPGAAPRGSLRVLAVQRLSSASTPATEGGAFEPSVNVDNAGTIFVTAPSSGFVNRRSHLWVSHDAGVTFVEVSPVDDSTGVSNLPAGFEGDVGVDAAGNAYFVDLTLAGTTVSRSMDGGRHWELRNANAFRLPGGDRPWVEGGSRDTVVVAWDRVSVVGRQLDLVPVVAVSRDGGLTFPIQTELATCKTFGEVDGGYQNGDLAIGPDDTIYLSVNCQGRGVEVHRSTDGGVSFKAFAVHASPRLPPDFVPVAVDAAGSVYVTWSEAHDGTTDAYYAASRDAGETWGPPILVSFHDGATMMPWIEANGNGHVAVAYYAAPRFPGAPYEIDSRASWFPFVTEVRDAASGRPEYRVAQMTAEAVATGPACGTQPPCPPGANGGLEDYLGVDLGPDGRVHVVWTTAAGAGAPQVEWGVAEASGP